MWYKWIFFVSFATLISCTKHNPSQPPRPTRNLIILIGDGMGPQQLALLASYRKLAPNPAGDSRDIAIERLLRRGESGLMMTFPYGALVVDSAASATQLATGQMSRSEMIGLNAEGKTAQTIMEKAAEAGKSTGLISNTRLTHATPASFAAHEIHRSKENQIAADLVQSGVDIMLSGGYRYFLPQDVNVANTPAAQSYRRQIPAHLPLTSSRNDNRDLIEQAQQSGYEIVYDRRALLASKQAKILGLFAPAAMPDAIRQNQLAAQESRAMPNLQEMTQKALTQLNKNPEGFVLMVESGQIDWAGHSNDVGTMLHEMLRFDALIGDILDWVDQRDDTLVVLTADHETGSFGFSYSRYQRPSPFVLEASGKTFQPNYNFGTVDVLDRIYQQKKSLAAIWNDFTSQPDDRQTAATLAKLVNESMAFKITTDQAAEVLRNAQELPDFPQINDFSEYYVNSTTGRTGLLARELAKDQQVVWGTGTHTTTPVVVGAYGPTAWTREFGGFWHSHEIGQKMMRALALPLPKATISAGSQPAAEQQ
jgi:alkaline phosphatase